MELKEWSPHRPSYYLGVAAGVLASAILYWAFDNNFEVARASLQDRNNDCIQDLVIDEIDGISFRQTVLFAQGDGAYLPLQQVLDAELTAAETEIRSKYFPSKQDSSGTLVD